MTSLISYAQNFEDVMLWRALGHIKNGFYIDIGAQDPLIDSVSLAFYEHGWRGIHVEPTPHYAERLRQQRPDDTVIQAAVGTGPAVLRFFEITNSGLSTADPVIAQQHRERGFDVHEITVPCIELSAIFSSCVEPEIHWLKIDAEGFEGQVLSSWGASAQRPWIVVVESTLPLTQVETYEIWESLLIGYGYSPVYFDGLNRYYVVDAHSELKNAFLAPPNIFDGFTLNGSASAPFHRLIEARYKQKISGILAQNEQQKLSTNNKIERLTLSITELGESHREQECALQHQLAAQEHALNQQLQNEHQELRRIEQERMKREQILSEQTSQARQELENLLRTLAQREQEVAAQLLALQQQAALEKDAQVRSHAEQERELHRQHTEREQTLYLQLQAGYQEQRRLEQDRAHREQEVAAQLLALQEQAALEKDAQVRSHAEQERELHRQYTEREQNLDLQLQAGQQELRRLEQGWAQNEKVLAKEIAALQNETQTLHHAQQLQAQQHDTELSTKLNEHNTLTEACAALEAQLKAEILLEQQTCQLLRQSLAEVEQSLATTHASLTWRMTAPLRKLAAFIVPKKNLGHASPIVMEATDTTIMMAAAEPQSINGQQTAIEPIMPATTDRANSPPPTPEMKEDGVQPLSFTPSIAETQPVNVQPSSIESTMPPPVTTLDELLSCHDKHFICCAYQTLLGREPDQEGLVYYLGRLRTGFSKMQIMAQLCFSKEGKAHATNLPGLEKAIKRYRKGQYPLIGWLFRGRYGTEGNQPTERKLRSIENQLLLHSDESNRRFNIMETGLAGLQNLVVDQTRSLAKALDYISLTRMPIPPQLSTQEQHINISPIKKMSSELTEDQVQSVNSITQRVSDIDDRSIDDLLQLTNENFTESIYQRFLGRRADADGKKFFNSHLASGGDRLQMARDLANSTEGQQYRLISTKQTTNPTHAGWDSISSHSKVFLSRLHACGEVN